MGTPKKIVVIGPESTGKSTLTRMLAIHYKMDWVREYAREYISGLTRDYTEDDLLEIARGQIQREENKAIMPLPYLFCDTDLYVIKVWSEHKYNRCPHWILQEIASRSYDLYLLTDIDMPWEQDPQREYPDPVMRSYFYQVYKDIVVHSGLPWVNVHGNEQERLHIATEAISRYL